LIPLLAAAALFCAMVARLSMNLVRLDTPPSALEENFDFRQPVICSCVREDGRPVDAAGRVSRMLTSRFFGARGSLRRLARGPRGVLDARCGIAERREAAIAMVVWVRLLCLGCVIAVADGSLLGRRRWG
jgi:hypothetical protein